MSPNMIKAFRELRGLNELGPNGPALAYGVRSILKANLDTIIQRIGPPVNERVERWVDRPDNGLTWVPLTAGDKRAESVS